MLIIEVVQTMRLFSQRVAGTESLFRVQCIAFRCVTLCDVTIHHRRYCTTDSGLQDHTWDFSRIGRIIMLKARDY